MTKTPNTDFLPAVAKYVLEQFGDNPERVVFVTPNKRTSLFLKRDYCRLLDRPAMLPHFATMANFLAGFSDRVVASADEQLFMLYNAYVNVLRKRNPEINPPEFDSFIFWGTMILSDFDEVNTSMVNIKALFKNLKDVKEIQANYLDDDQIAVINKIWGEGLVPKGNTEFWKHLKKDDGDFKGDMSAKFYAIWELLDDLYAEFTAMMEMAEMVSAGVLERRTLEKLKATPVETLKEDKIFIFVGHNTVTKAEALIMKRLKDAGAALFFWDTAVLDLFANSLTQSQPRPLRILKGLVSQFPMPDDFTVPKPEKFATLHVQAVPSNVGQTKLAHKQLADWVKEGYIRTNAKEDAPDPLRTAVILPDPDLLVPLLFAIPADIDPVNIAMGIPYRVTGFATFFSSLISMQLRAKKYSSGINYYYEDLKNVLMQPHVRLFNAEAADAIINRIVKERLYNVPADWLLDNFPEMAPLFTPVKDRDSVEAVTDYLDKLFVWVEEGLETVGKPDVPSEGVGNEGDAQKVEPSYESKMLRYFRTIIERLCTLIERYRIVMKEHTFLHLFERVFAQRGIIASGQPLEGMQVLGVLETRAIDFDNVIITSMNERIYPKRQYSNTMIPNALRIAYGMNEFDVVEHTYAYCFYRMMVRSKRVSVYYDARTDGMGGGEVSRYVTQVRYLLPDVKVESETMSYSTAIKPMDSFEIVKDENVMRNLNRMLYSEDGPAKAPSFSASALKAYLNCPLSFYLQYTLGFREPEELVDYKSAADYGTIFHNVVQRLFKEAPHGRVDKKVLESFKANDDLIHKLAVKGVLLSDQHDRSLTIDDMPDSANLDPESELIVSYVEVNVKNMLDVEIATLGDDYFHYLASEWNFESPTKVVPWTIGDRTIRFKMSIDRIDRLPDGTLRLIDFKTGSDELTVEKIDGVFSDNHGKHAIFQLLLYSQALLDNKEHAKSLEPIREIEPVISATRKIATTCAWERIKIDKEVVKNYSQVQAEFVANLKDLINEIFNPDVPIRQAENEKCCKYCSFKSLCGRYPQDDF